jgi:2-iminobutanoate/2-iminopropanoate deaminase
MSFRGGKIDHWTNASEMCGRSVNAPPSGHCSGQRAGGLVFPVQSRAEQQESPMRREINPETFPKPQSNYSQGVVHGPIKERLVISGQVGVRPDGSVADGLEAQMAQTWENFLAVLGSAGFQTADVVKVTVYVTEPGLQEFRRGREAALAGYAPAATYVEVAGLADPRFLVEIEGEAVKS